MNDSAEWCVAAVVRCVAKVAVVRCGLEQERGVGQRSTSVARRVAGGGRSWADKLQPGSVGHRPGGWLGVRASRSFLAGSRPGKASL